MTYSVLNHDPERPLARTTQWVSMQPCTEEKYTCPSQTPFEQMPQVWGLLPDTPSMHATISEPQHAVSRLASVGSRGDILST
jgi:hypothetical protein